MMFTCYLKVDKVDPCPTLIIKYPNSVNPLKFDENRIKPGENCFPKPDFRPLGIVLGIMLLAGLALVACKGPVGNKTMREGEFPEGRPTEGVPSTEQTRPGSEPEVPQVSRLPEGSAIPGIYFLHDFPAWPAEAPAAGCTFIKQHLAGHAEIANGLPKDMGQGAGAVLELAEQARNLGGNVVLLPHFSTEFEEGVLTGHLYRCDAESRKRLHASGAAEHRLTVVE